MADDSTNYPSEQDLVDFPGQLRATEGELEPALEPGQLSPAHQAYLQAQAIDVQLADALGVRTLTGPANVADLGDAWERWANFPAILFPWTSPDGRVEYQVRPDDPTLDARSRPRKYVFRKDMQPVLWAVRPVENAQQVLIVEGTKQCLAAASYAPAGTEVYGIAGCRAWQVDGIPIPDLAVVDGRHVVVVLDADAQKNPDVYAAGVGLAQALAAEGAESVKFARLPAAGKSGLDDVLAGRPADRRAGYLARIIDAARAKPADKQPPPRKKSSDMPADPDGERVTVVVNRDRFEVINEITHALVTRWNGRDLFNHGGVISRLSGHTMAPIDRGTSRDLLQETAIIINENQTAQGTTYDYTWPDSNSIAAVMSRADKFAPLERVSRAPFVRPDGSIVTEPGYDEATRTMLVPDRELANLQVPENPSREQIAAARSLLMDDWLGDFPFESAADRANVLALALTPAIRNLVPRVPLAVIDGLQMGVGKNLLADCLLTIYTGQPASPMNFVDEREELRKQITSAFRTGAEFFVFDEAHTLDGTALAQALTASTWQDRILGFSQMAEFPNRVTWMSLGNNVAVRGDMTRRVYRVALRPDYEHPQDRPAHTFRHPGTSGLDLGSWTRANRRELLRAILILVRGWFAAGQPAPARGISFGSFETWEKVVGGIVQVAGLPDFLGNLTVWRSESDFDTQYWTQHLAWLFETFGTEPFRCADAKAKALADPQGFLAPPRLDDLVEKGYTKALGEAYHRLRGRRYDGYRIAAVGGGRGKVTKWQVSSDSHGAVRGSYPQQPQPDHPRKQGGTRRDPEEAPLSIGVSTTSYMGGGEVGGTGRRETWDVGEGRSPQVPPGPSTLAQQSEHETQDVGEGRSPQVPPGPYRPGQQPGVVVFDLETGSAGDLYRTAGRGYVRLAGWAVGDQPVEMQSGGAWETIQVIQHGAVATGHNIMAFDLPALVRADQGLTMQDVHELVGAGRIFDTLLAARHLDPPMARDKGVDAQRRHDLDSLGERLGLGRKVVGVKELAKAHGGWDRIPTEDPLFREYLTGDVELSRKLYAYLNHQLDDPVIAGARDYLDREHRVAAIAAQITHNGFRVDEQTLGWRVANVRERKAQSLALLHERYGVPLADAKGKLYDAPLATKAGKAALAGALTEAGATSLWTTEKTGDLAISGDHMLHLSQEYHHLPAVREIAKHVYRIVSARTVYETVAAHLCPDGRVHPRVAFKQATGRWSLTEPGLTVMGKRGGRHVEREIFLPDPGELVVAVDLSQVDMRGVAGLSQDHAYIRMLTTEDPHSEIAKALFGSVERREQAKAIGHGWNYGRGIKAISDREDIDPQLVRQFDHSMRERFPRLVEWQGEVRALAESGQLLDNGFGRPMRPDPRRAYTQGPALMGQGAARDLMMEGLLRLAGQHPETLPMLRAQIHDELVLSVPADLVEDVRRAVLKAFTWEWKGVPIVADSGPAGETWGHVYSK